MVLNLPSDFFNARKELKSRDSYVKLEEVRSVCGKTDAVNRRNLLERKYIILITY